MKTATMETANAVQAAINANNKEGERLASLFDALTDENASEVQLQIAGGGTVTSPGSAVQQN